MVNEKTLERMKYRNKHQSINTRRQSVFSYLDEPEEKRLDLKKFLKSHKMLKRTFYLLEGEYKSKKKALGVEGVENHRQEVRGQVMDAFDRLEGKEPPKRIKNQEVVEISEDEKLALGRKVYKDAMLPGASAKDKDLAVRMLGMLIEKSIEVKVGVNADELARQHIENQRWLREQGFLETEGVGQVQPKPSLLLDDIREDTG